MPAVYSFVASLSSRSGARASAYRHRTNSMPQEIKPSWPIPSEVKWESVNGYPMAYRDAGNGTPIVLVHGAVNDYRAWNAQFDVFSKTHRVIAVSLRHYYPERG